MINNETEIQTATNETQQLRRDLQKGNSKDMRRRRVIINLSLLGIGAMAAATLFLAVVFVTALSWLIRLL